MPEDTKHLLTMRHVFGPGQLPAEQGEFFNNAFQFVFCCCEAAWLVVFYRLSNRRAAAPSGEIFCRKTVTVFSVLRLIYCNR